MSTQLYTIKRFYCKDCQYGPENISDRRVRNCDCKNPQTYEYKTNYVTGEALLLTRLCRCINRDGLCDYYKKREDGSIKKVLRRIRFR